MPIDSPPKCRSICAPRSTDNDSCTIGADRFPPQVPFDLCTSICRTLHASVNSVWCVGPDLSSGSTGTVFQVCGDHPSSWICFDLADSERGVASERELCTSLCRRNGLLPTVRSLVFVLDASRPEDFGHARERLARLLAQEWAAPHIPSRRPPLVVLAHKADRSGARTAVEVSEALGVDQLRLDRPVLCTSSMHADAGAGSLDWRMS